MKLQQAPFQAENLRNPAAVSEGNCCGSCQAGGCPTPAKPEASSCEGKRIALTPDVYPVAQPTPELLAELEEASRMLEGKSPEEILAWAVGRYFPRFTMATAFGPEGCVIQIGRAHV